MESREDAIKKATEHLVYEPETGHLIWLKPIGSHPTHIGKRAGYKGHDGYRYIKIFKYRLLEHRLCWLLTYGNLPYQIDHINMQRDDNRLCNLRAATNSQNSMNKAAQANNTSGFKGVTFNKSVNKFHAKISLKGKSFSLGYHDTAEQASLAYITKQGELHGQFART